MIRDVLSLTALHSYFSLESPKTFPVKLNSAEQSSLSPGQKLSETGESVNQDGSLEQITLMAADSALWRAHHHLTMP